jgi:hypothetical protein
MITDSITTTPLPRTNTMKTQVMPAVASLQTPLREDCAREVFAVAEALRRTGRHRRLRDVTIVLPIDHTAVEAIELACQTLTEGELTTASADLERFLDRLVEDPPAAERFLQSVRNVVRRVGPTRSAR